MSPGKFSVSSVSELSYQSKIHQKRKALAVTDVTMKYLTDSRIKIVSLCFINLWKFHRNENFLYRLYVFILWKNTKELVPSWRVFLLNHVYFKTEQLLKRHAGATPKQWLTETWIVSPAAEWPTRN